MPNERKGLSGAPQLALLEPKPPSLIEQVCPTCAQVHDLGAPITVFLQSRAFGTVIRVGDTRGAANNAPTAVGTKITFVTDADKCLRPNVRVADWAFSVALLAQAADSNTRLSPAHNQIGMVLGHGVVLS